ELWGDCELVERLFAELFFLGLHNVGKCWVTRLVESLLGGDDGGEFESEGFAAFVGVVLAGEGGAFEFEGAGPGDLGPVEAFGGGGGEGVRVPVGLLAAGENEGCLLLRGELGEDFAEGDGVEAGVGFDVDGAVGSHGEGGAEGVLNAGRADGGGDDL